MIGVIFGGSSLEHEVSIKSADDVIQHFNIMKFYLRKDGQWEVNGEVRKEIIPMLNKCKVIFPLIHGTTGEDGVLQGFLELLKVPYIGCPVAASSICMDKDFTKRILESYGIATTKFQTFTSIEQAKKANISAPCVVKAASLGSSIGVYKVDSCVNTALEKAFSFCNKVIVEETIEGRELWCSVLEDKGKLVISDPCEIIPKGGFFSYDNKYKKDDGAVYHVPAKDINKEKIKQITSKVFISLGCKDMARVDLFLTKAGEVLVNEVNTIPGFSKQSLFPKSLYKKGYSYEKIICTLIKNNIKTECFEDISRNLLTSKEGMLM